tara:strand:+ start:213 stop:491 length:279 start_codon:yes stop_codon:yes gene_type:complete
MNIDGEIASALLGQFMQGNLTEAELRNETNFFYYADAMHVATEDESEFDVEAFCDNLKQLVEVCNRSLKIRTRVPAICRVLNLAVSDLVDEI